MAKFNINSLKNSAVIKANKHLFAAKKSPALSKEKAFIEAFLKDYCKKNNYTLLVEHKFHPIRKWRFDWFIKEISIAIEYNGIISAKSRHTTITGYTNDMTKINQAQLLGYKVLQYTPLNYKMLVQDLPKKISAD